MGLDFLVSLENTCSCIDCGKGALLTCTVDFYDWQPEGQDSFVMMAGSAFEVTEFDAWMLRDWYRKLKAERGW